MTLHVVGAGLAGLSCALAAADAGWSVAVHEAAGHAGGRCRSFHEPKLDRRIDNGTHMVVGGNRAVFDFLKRIGSTDELVGCPPVFPMLDLDSGRRWQATPLALLPSAIAAAWALRHGKDAGITARLGSLGHFTRFWDPLAVAVMNTPATDASALVFRRVLARTLWRGQAASRPFLARNGLSETFIEPALKALAAAGAGVHLHHPLRRLSWSGAEPDGLVFDDGEVRLGAGDAVVLALPWAVARSMVPGIPDFPDSPIVNAHFRLAVTPAKQSPGGFLGLLGGTGQWLFLRGDVLSVTVSAAAGLAERSVDEVAGLLWADAARALSLPGEPAAVRVIKEKRATIFHTPEMEILRPHPRVARNLILAGDWTGTGLPCTIEGALCSGAEAARQLKN